MGSQATRAALLVAARKAFSDQGYGAASLGEIAMAAQATTGSIYHHFDNKEGLLLAVARSVEEEILAAVIASMPVSTDPWEQLGHALEVTLTLCAKPDVGSIIFREAPSVLGIVRWREIEMSYGFGGMQSLLVQISERGELDPNDPALVARVLLGALIQAAEVEAERQPKAAGLSAVAITRILQSFRAR